MILAVIGLVLAAAILISMSSCIITSNGTLTIRNLSNYDIDFVTWTSDNAITYNFGNDLVWDYTMGADVFGIAALGGIDSQDVDPGTDYIYFFFTDDPIGKRTASFVTVGEFTDASFTFRDTTIYVAGTLRDGSTESRVYAIVPVPGMTKPTK
jgi:hypothetical protein